jgi:hypothetical protein
MKSLLANFTNQFVQVAIPKLFGDDELHVCKLVFTEHAGIWFESEGLTKSVYGREDVEIVAVFVPFVHLNCLVPGPATPARREKAQPSSHSAQKPAHQESIPGRANRETPDESKKRRGPKG